MLWWCVCVPACEARRGVLCASAFSVPTVTIVVDLDAHTVAILLTRVMDKRKAVVRILQGSVFWCEL